MKALFDRTPSFSFEFFPPKSPEGAASLLETVVKLQEFHPSFVSVTYGAGGSTDIYTPEIAACILKKGVTPLAHLTCISLDEEKVDATLNNLKDIGVDNILALRGDLPKGVSEHKGAYMHASDLVAKIREFGGFCIGGACYPEGHPEAKNLEDDIEKLKIKLDAGCEFLTTQMFFDNNIIYSYMDKLHTAGIFATVVPGIMPITNGTQVERAIKLSGSFMPQRFKSIVDKFGSTPEAMKQAGIAYATDQIIDLFANGITNVHVYSMNKPDVAAKIQENLSDILGI